MLLSFFDWIHTCPEMGWLLSLGYLALVVAVATGTERRQHQVQHGPCSYTFILPEVEQCPSPGNVRVSNSLQRDSPLPPDAAQTEKKLESLESATENNTLWLQKVRSNTLCFQLINSLAHIKILRSSHYSCPNVDKVSSFFFKCTNLAISSYCLWNDPLGSFYSQIHVWLKSKGKDLSLMHFSVPNFRATPLHPSFCLLFQSKHN